MKIVILSRNPHLYSTRRLTEAAVKRGHQVEVMNPLSCFMTLRRRRPQLFYCSKQVEAPDAVIPRIGASITVYGLAVVRQFEMMGVYCVNPAPAIARSRDKLQSMQVLSLHDIGMPPTGLARQEGDVKDVIRKIGGAPVIIKLLAGTQGMGVIRADSDASASSVIETLHGLDQNILVQKFIADANGADIRALVVGRRVVAAMKRTAKEGEFRSNIHRGGTAEAIELAAEYRRVAVKAARVLGLNVAGVDLLVSRRGPLILEVNSSPGMEGIERACQIDVAGSVIRFIEQQLRAGTHDAVQV